MGHRPTQAVHQPFDRRGLVNDLNELLAPNGLVHKKMDSAGGVRKPSVLVPRREMNVDPLEVATPRLRLRCSFTHLGSKAKGGMPRDVRVGLGQGAEAVLQRQVAEW
jgi:hypothetical protein